MTQLRRQVRKRDKLVIDGPATVEVTEGHAVLIVSAERTVKIEHQKRRPVKRGVRK